MSKHTRPTDLIDALRRARIQTGLEAKLLAWIDLLEEERTAIPALVEAAKLLTSAAGPTFVSDCNMAVAKARAAIALLEAK